MTKYKNSRTGGGRYLPANMPSRAKFKDGAAKASKTSTEARRKDLVELNAHSIVYEVDHGKPVQVFPSRWDLTELGVPPVYHWDGAPDILVTLYLPMSPKRAISLLKAVIGEIEENSFPNLRETHERDKAQEIREERILGEEIRAYDL